MVRNTGIIDLSLHPLPPFHFIFIKQLTVEGQAHRWNKDGTVPSALLCVCVKERHKDRDEESKRGRTERDCAVGLMLESSPPMLFLLTLHYRIQGRRERMNESIIDNAAPSWAYAPFFILSQTGLRRSSMMLLDVFGAVYFNHLSFTAASETKDDILTSSLLMRITNDKALNSLNTSQTKWRHPCERPVILSSFPALNPFQIDHFD